MKKMLACTCTEKCGALSLMILRIVIGLIFALHGYQKLSMGVDGFAGMLVSLNVPAALVMAWVVTLVELVGGILIIIGFVHWPSKLLIIDMLAALWLVHFSKGFFFTNGGYEYNLLLIAALFVLMGMGPGKGMLSKRRITAQQEQASPSGNPMKMP